jgi:uncharacterized protein (TIGR00369 family)
MSGMTEEKLRRGLADPNNAPPATRHLGFELIDLSVDGAWAEMAFHPKPEFANPQGNVQGGFICAMLDDAMAIAASVSRRMEIVVPTVQITITYVRPTPLTRVIARGEVLRVGATSAQMQGTLRLPDGTLLATALAAAVVRPFPAPTPAINTVGS